MNEATRKRAAAIRHALLNKREHVDVCACHACAEAALYEELTATSDELRDEISQHDCQHERLEHVRHALRGLANAVRLLEMPTGVLLTNGERDGLTKH